MSQAEQLLERAVVFVIAEPFGVAVVGEQLGARLAALVD